MLMVKKIGGIELENKLWFKESFDVKNVRGIAFNTIGGGKVVYESIKRNNANYITLESKNNGWIKEDTLKKIATLADDIGVETTIVFDNDNEVKVRFAYEKGEVIKAEPIYEGSKWYRVEINLCRV